MQAVIARLDRPPAAIGGLFQALSEDVLGRSGRHGSMAGFLNDEAVGPASPAPQTNGYPYPHGKDLIIRSDGANAADMAFRTVKTAR